MGAESKAHPEACGINANGHRFVRRGAAFGWMHPADMREGDEDCSAMSDAEFEACVASHVWRAGVPA